MKTHQPQMFQSIIVMQVLHIFYQFSCLSLNLLDQLIIFSKVWAHAGMAYRHPFRSNYSRMVPSPIYEIFSIKG